ncbi:MAG: SMP-30/gluconolactonase/LRE family protein [Fimbriimonadaceae bacterium]|nr:SMP-30/gluconolactonase/LRE family protein [Fimbriimonadaceae bacterium]
MFAAATLVSSADADLGPIEPLKTVASGLRFTEGPASDAAGNLYFTDIPANRIMVLRPDGKLEVFLEDSKAANGLLYRFGKLYACQGGAPAVSTVDLLTKAVTPLVQAYDGKPLNAPNDLTVDAHGGVYFTDPLFGEGPLSQGLMGVYYTSAKGETNRLVGNLPWPNGIALSRDEKTLYVLPTGDPYLRAYDVLKPGVLGPERRLYEFENPNKSDFPGGDGMTIDEQGNLYLTAVNLKQVVVVSPEGKRLAALDVPVSPTNCVFGGKDLRTLYVTGADSLFATRLKVRGWRPK